MLKTETITPVEAWCAEKGKTLQPQTVLEAVLKAFPDCYGGKLTESRQKPYPDIRQAYIWFCHQLTTADQKEIMSLIGKDRTTHNTNLNRAKGFIQSGDELFNDIVTQIWNCLQ